jgi:hypothetical protein
MTGLSRSDPRHRHRIFPLASVSRPALGLTQPAIQWVPGVLSPGLKRGWGVTLTTLVPSLRMSRSYTSSLPRVIVACSGTALAFSSAFRAGYRTCMHKEIVVRQWEEWSLLEHIVALQWDLFTLVEEWSKAQQWQITWMNEWPKAHCWPCMEHISSTMTYMSWREDTFGKPVFYTPFLTCLSSVYWIISTLGYTRFPVRELLTLNNFANLSNHSAVYCALRKITQPLQMIQ